MHASSFFSLIAAFAIINAAPTPTSIPQAPLPTIDLGYGIHRAISFNTSSSLFNFSNIRFAEPPIGNLRFEAPVPVTGRNRTVSDGSVGRICPQAQPGWFPEAEAFVTDYVSGQPFTGPPSTNGSVQQAPDPRMSEDCLFLDVIVPKSVLESTNNKSSGAPAVVWIYGGGYVFGDKTGYDPSGLIASSPEPFIFVALNYRLGAFGFLSGPTLQSSGMSQPGLLDQRLALAWVQKHIHLFGGSPSRITAMGESAGGGSIMHQITAYGGKNGSAPFQRAILQSPAFTAQPEAKQAENHTQTFMHLCNVSSIDALRELSSKDLMAANAQQVAASNYGEFTFGPVVDGDFVPALPGQLLERGAFDRSVEVMVGHNSDEGILFTSPMSNTSSGFTTMVKEFFPYMSEDVLRRVEDDIYPPNFNGSEPYTNQLDRTKLMVADTFVTCNTDYLNKAFADKTYAYEYSVFPGTHGQDLTYTFADGVANGTITSVAAAMQRYLSSFASQGVPRGRNASLPDFPQHGSDAKMLDIGATSIQVKSDPTRNQRCRFWQDASETQ